MYLRPSTMITARKYVLHCASCTNTAARRPRTCGARERAARAGERGWQAGCETGVGHRVYGPRRARVAQRDECRRRSGSQDLARRPPRWRGFSYTNFNCRPVARPRRAGGAPPPHHHSAHRPACTFNCESPCCRSASSYESEVVKATHKCGFGLERDRITEPMRATLLSLAPLPSIPQVARREPDVP